MNQAYAVWDREPQLTGDDVTEEDTVLQLCLKRLGMWAGMKDPTVSNLGRAAPFNNREF